MGISLKAKRASAPPEAKEGQSRKISAIEIWGAIQIVLVALWTIAPYDGNINPFQYQGWDALAFSGLLFIGCSVGFGRARLQPYGPTVFAALLCVWGVICTVYIEYYIGRTSALWFKDSWTLHFIIQLYVVVIFSQLVPWGSRFIVNALLSVFVFSGIFAYFQFLGVGFFLRLIPSQTLSQEFGGIRAVGIAGHPAFAALHAVLGASLVVARFAYRKPLRWEFLLLLFFLGYLFIAQYRTLYLGGLILTILAIRYMFKSSKKFALVFVGVIAIGLGGLLQFFPEKFSYILSTETFQLSARVRQEASLSQLPPIFDAFPVTGIGPDRTLMTGSPDGYVGYNKWSQYVMDSSIALLLACYGFPGLVLGSGIVVSAIIGLFVLNRRKTLSPEAHILILGGLLASTQILIVFASLNVIVIARCVYWFAIVCGLGFSVKPPQRYAVTWRSRSVTPSQLSSLQLLKPSTRSAIE